MKPVRNLDDLLALGSGYQKSMILLCSVRLGVFRGLADGPLDASSLAQKIGADPLRLGILLDALALLELIHKTGGRYRLSGAARQFLLPGVRSQESILLHVMNCWSAWENLEGKIRRGRKNPGSKSEYQENFVRGMGERSRERAHATVRKFPLKDGERLLDLGGGPGMYAAAWAKAYPGAEIFLFDLPETLRVTRKIIAEDGNVGRVRLLRGDFLKDSIGGPYNFVWISQILHAFSEKDCIGLLGKARDALLPGGKAAVHEFMVSEKKTSPPGPVFFSVHMVAVTEGGRTYTAKEIAAMMKKAGFCNIRTFPPDRDGVGIMQGAR